VHFLIFDLLLVQKYNSRFDYCLPLVFLFASGLASKQDASIVVEGSRNANVIWLGLSVGVLCVPSSFFFC